MDFKNTCRDEIALEGLDGITLSALWLRLDNVRPPFPLALDDDSKAFLWDMIATMDDIDFYEMKEPRANLVIFDRFKLTDPETGICLESPNIPPDIYPINIIRDGNISGSCVEYYTRKKITEKIRNKSGKLLCSVDEVTKRWGERFLIVASQEMRTEALFGPEADPNLVLPEKHYALLERIGRSRWQGEVTQGKHSLQVFKDNSKTLFYLRKVLNRHGLITVQAFNQKLLKGNNSAGKLIHLRRFCEERKPTYLGLLEALTSRLASKPFNREVLGTIRAEMGLNDKMFKKLYQLGSHYVKTDLLPYREVYPEAPESQYLVKSGAKERFLRVLTLIKRYEYVMGGGANDEEDEEEEDVEEKLLKGKEVMAWDRVRELPLLHQAFHFIMQHKDGGATQLEVSQAFNVTKLESRQLCRNLERREVVKRILKDIGKQRVHVYVAKEWVGMSSLLKQLEQEKVKIKRHSLAIKSDLDESIDHELHDTPMGTPRSSRASTPSQTPAKNELLFYDDEEEGEINKLHMKKKHVHVTYRLLRRANIVIEAVKEAKLIDNLYYIQKKIIDEEASEGIQTKLDKKSLVRLIQRLSTEGQIKSIKTLIKFGNEEKELHFVVDPSVSPEDQIVKSAIESAKMRHLALSKEITRDIMSQSKTKESKELSVPQGHDMLRPNYALLKSQLSVEDMTYDSEAGRRYGYVPRMKRCHLVHEVLWYLVYGYDQDDGEHRGERDYSPEDSISSAVVNEPGTSRKSIKMEHSSRNAKAKTGDSLLDGAVVYKDERGWRRFMPSLPMHSGYAQGWCLIGDVLLILPISLFCQIIRVNFKIRGLEEFLRHPLKRYLTVSQLPTSMRQQLMFERKFVYNFFEVCTFLCQMGLVSFGKREWKDKEQIFLYLHKNCSVLDTTCGAPDEYGYDVRHFQLNTYKDFHEFWFTLQWVCLNTPLDVMNSQGEQSGSKTTVRLDRFAECVEGKSPEEVVDDGHIPGNQLGAGGLDTIFWAHLKRNWSYNADIDVKVESILKVKRKSDLPQPRKKKPKVVSDVGVKKQYPGVKPKTKKSDVRLVKTNKEKRQPSKRKKGKRFTNSVENDNEVPVQNEKSPLVPVAGTSKTPSGAPILDKDVSEQKPVENAAPKAKKRPLTAAASAEGAKKRKRAKYYDDVDKEALRRMTKERVTWTSEEDSLLLLCQVTNLLLGGHRRDFLVSFSVVRDIMHQNFHTSQDKTSKACQRRLRYILKNSQTTTNVNMYLGEALQDKSLVEQFQKGKKYVRSHVEENLEAFKAVLEKLRKKFGSSTEDDSIQDLPDNIEEIYRKYHVSLQQGPPQSQHHDPVSEHDIQFSVLHNLIHSAMLLQDKTGHAHELYQLFSQYSEDLLLAVFTSMKNDGIVTKVKPTGPTKGNTCRRSTTVPSVAMGSYQMAQRYTYNWFTRYPKTIFLQTFNVMMHLGQGQANGHNQPSPQGQTKSQGQEEGQSPEIPGYEMEENGGFSSNVISLMATRQIKFEVLIPEHIIVVESSVKSEGKKSKQKSKMAASELGLGTQSDEEEEALIEEAEKSRQGPAASDESRSVEDLLASLSQAESTDLTDKKHSIAASRINLTLVRGQSNGKADMADKILAPSDNIVINSCRMYISLSPEVMYCNKPKYNTIWGREIEAHKEIQAYNSISSWLHPRTCYRMLRHIRLIQPFQIDMETFLQKTCPQKWDMSEEEVEWVKVIVKKVEKHGILGMTSQDVKSSFGNITNLEKIMNALQEHHVVVAVGVTVRRYVHYEHIRPWLINSYKNLKGRGVRNPEGDEDVELTERDISKSPPAQAPSGGRLRPNTKGVSGHTPATPAQTDGKIPGGKSSLQESDQPVQKDQEPAEKVQTNQEPDDQVEKNQEPAEQVQNQEPAEQVQNQEPAEQGQNQEPTEQVQNQEPAEQAQRDDSSENPKKQEKIDEPYLENAKEMFGLKNKPAPLLWTKSVVLLEEQNDKTCKTELQSEAKCQDDIIADEGEVVAVESSAEEEPVPSVSQEVDLNATTTQSSVILTSQDGQALLLRSPSTSGRVINLQLLGDSVISVQPESPLRDTSLIPPTENTSDTITLSQPFQSLLSESLGNTTPVLHPGLMVSSTGGARVRLPKPTGNTGTDISDMSGVRMRLPAPTGNTNPDMSGVRMRLPAPTGNTNPDMSGVRMRLPAPTGNTNPDMSGVRMRLPAPTGNTNPDMSGVRMRLPTPASILGQWRTSSLKVRYPAPAIIQQESPGACPVTPEKETLKTVQTSPTNTVVIDNPKELQKSESETPAGPEIQKPCTKSVLQETKAITPDALSSPPQPQRMLSLVQKSASTHSTEVKDAAMPPPKISHLTAIKQTSPRSILRPGYLPRLPVHQYKPSEKTSKPAETETPSHMASKSSTMIAPQLPKSSGKQPVRRLQTMSGTDGGTARLRTLSLSTHDASKPGASGLSEGTDRASVSLISPEVLQALKAATASEQVTPPETSQESTAPLVSILQPSSSTIRKISFSQDVPSRTRTLSSSSSTSVTGKPSGPESSVVGSMCQAGTSVVPQQQQPTTGSETDGTMLSRSSRLRTLSSGAESTGEATKTFIVKSTQGKSFAIISSPPRSSSGTQQHIVRSSPVKSTQGATLTTSGQKDSTHVLVYKSGDVSGKHSEQSSPVSTASELPSKTVILKIPQGNVIPQTRILNNPSDMVSKQGETPGGTSLPCKAVTSKLTIQPTGTQSDVTDEAAASCPAIVTLSPTKAIAGENSQSGGVKSDKVLGNTKVPSSKVVVSKKLYSEVLASKLDVTQPQSLADNRPSTNVTVAVKTPLVSAQPTGAGTQGQGHTKGPNPTGAGTQVQGHMKETKPTRVVRLVNPMENKGLRAVGVVKQQMAAPGTTMSPRSKLRSALDSTMVVKRARKPIGSHGALDSLMSQSASMSKSASAPHTISPVNTGVTHTQITAASAITLSKANVQLSTGSAAVLGSAKIGALQKGQQTTKIIQSPHNVQKVQILSQSTPLQQQGTAHSKSIGFSKQSPVKPGATGAQVKDVPHSQATSTARKAQTTTPQQQAPIGSQIGHAQGVRRGPLIRQRSPVSSPQPAAKQLISPQTALPSQSHQKGPTTTLPNTILGQSATKQLSQFIASGGTQMAQGLQQQLGQIISGAMAKGGSGPIRIKLPPGCAVPTGNQPMRVSVITPDQARRMGLPMPKGGTAGTRASGIQGLRMTNPGSVQAIRHPGPASSLHAGSSSQVQSGRRNATRPEVATSSAQLRHPRPVAVSRSISQASSRAGTTVVASRSAPPTTVKPLAATPAKQAAATASSQAQVPLIRDLMQSLQERVSGQDDSELPQVDGPPDKKARKDKKSSPTTAAKSKNQPEEVKAQKEGEQTGDLETMNIGIDSTEGTISAGTEKGGEEPMDSDISTPAPRTQKPPSATTSEPSTQKDISEEAGHQGQEKAAEKKPQRRRRRLHQMPPVSSSSSQYQRVQLVIRPWRTPDGTINRPSLKLMLEAVLAYVVTKPGVTLPNIYDKYNPILQPVLVLELLEMLEEIGCVTKKAIMKSHKATVFSTRPAYNEAVDDSSEDAMLAYFPTIDCILKLGYFQAQLVGNYPKD